MCGELLSHQGSKSGLRTLRVEREELCARYQRWAEAGGRVFALNCFAFFCWASRMMASPGLGIQQSLSHFTEEDPQ